MRKAAWISKQIFEEWGLDSQGGTILETSKINRSYEIWERANSLVINTQSNFDLSDAVLNLKRSLDTRLQLIEKIYRLKEKDIQDKPKHYLDLLSHLEIIRPLLFHKLLNIRNAIEHEDKKPPNKKECEELVDIVWYFLKSTDNLVAVERSGFETEFDQYFYGLDINWKTGKIEIRGWFPEVFVSKVEKEHFFKIQIKLQEKKANFKEKQKFKDHANKLDADTWLIGKIEPTPLDTLELYRKVFSVYS